jgi:hypothetical protein
MVSVFARWVGLELELDEGTPVVTGCGGFLSGTAKDPAYDVRLRGFVDSGVLFFVTDTAADEVRPGTGRGGFLVGTAIVESDEG